LKIGIINYQACNLKSIYSTVYNLGYDPIIIENKIDFLNINKIIIPGVGSAKHCIDYLKKKKFFEEIIKFKNLGMPILGICLGMHLFAEKLFEHGESQGFGFIKGEVIPLTMNSKFNIGWHKLKINKTENRFIKKINNDATFYFCHSYYFNISQSNSEYSIATVNLDKEVPSIICKDNILGVQFHPERSQNHGVNFIENFIKNFQ